VAHSFLVKPSCRGGGHSSSEQGSRQGWSWSQGYHPCSSKGDRSERGTGAEIERSAMPAPASYSKWDKLDVSDDKDDIRAKKAAEVKEDMTPKGQSRMTRIKPEPGFVVKTCLKGGTQVVMLNVVQHADLAPATSTFEDGREAWYLPYIISPALKVEKEGQGGRRCARLRRVFLPKRARARQGLRLVENHGGLHRPRWRANDAQDRARP